MIMMRTNDVMEAALINHLWQSTLIVLLIWLLTLSVRSHPARLRYRLWMAASLQFLLPLSLLVPLGTTLRSAIPTLRPRPALSSMMQRVAVPFPQQAILRAPSVAAIATPSHNSDAAFTLMLAVWLCGFVMVLAPWVRACLQVRALTRSAALLACVSDIPVLSSSDIPEPGVFGIFRPVLLLPERIADRLSPGQMETILTHELAHVRRRDNLTAALHMAVTALFWFHPAVWLIRTRLLEERELACDEAVIESGTEAELYAESILTVCRHSIAAPLACMAGVSGANLKERIVRIMTGQVVRSLGFHRKLLLGAAGLAVIAAPVLLGLAQAERAHGQAAPAKVPTGFDVISIRPHKGSHDGMSMGNNNGNFRAVNVSLQDLFENAYGIRRGLLYGLPSWSNSARWDIEAKLVDTPEDVRNKLTEEQSRALLASMLASRFHARSHEETKQLPVYDLVIAKNGPRFAQNAAENADLIKTVGGSGMSSGWNGKYQYVYCHDFNLASLVWSLSSYLNRNVIDKTGLTGNYSFALKFSGQDMTGAPDDDSAAAAGDSGPSLFTALEEQVGLKLVPSKGPVTTVVVDHVEEPSAN